MNLLFDIAVAKTSKAFKRYVRSCNIEIIDSQDPLVRLKITKSSIIDFFKDLINGIEGFKYQITLKVKQIQRKYRQRVYSYLF